MKTFKCWNCGKEQLDQPLPLARLAECSGCRAELHVCRMCEFFDTSVANSCREPVAERVMDKNRANFCGYLQPSASAWNPDESTHVSGSQRELEALFGGQPLPGVDADGAGSGSDTLPTDLESLFKSNPV
jgi:hypothetical protein